jgi:hypothetical protein
MEIEESSGGSSCGGEDNQQMVGVTAGGCGGEDSNTEACEDIDMEDVTTTKKQAVNDKGKGVGVNLPFISTVVSGGMMNHQKKL